MRRSDSLGEEFVRLTLVVEEHVPGKKPVTPSQVRLWIDSESRRA